MSLRYKSFVESESTKLTKKIESILIIEKSLECNGEAWIENINIIEHFLTRVVGRINGICPLFRSTLVLRRLPPFTIPYINTNEYAVVLENLPFTIPTKSPSPSTSRNKFLSNCHIEVQVDEDFKFDECVDEIGRELMCNDGEKYKSHQLFYKFARLFTQISDEFLRDEGQSDGGWMVDEERKQVQLLGPQLLKDIKMDPEVKKIFRLHQVDIPLRKRLISVNLTVKASYESNTIRIQYKDTEVVIRPCLFSPQISPKAFTTVYERVPLYHPFMHNISAALSKGCILFPTSHERIWQVQFWPTEAHLINTFHPTSLTLRCFKIFAAFCINPINFWESMNNNFLVGTEDIDSYIYNDSSSYTIDTTITVFLNEMEKFHSLNDWSPRNFPTRIFSLFRSTTRAVQANFLPHYVSSINIFSHSWNSCHEDLVRMSYYGEESCHEYAEQYPETLKDLDEFGLSFETLETIDSEKREDISRGSRLVSSIKGSFKEKKQRIYKTVSGGGGTITRLFGHKASRSRSFSASHKTMNDIASEFEQNLMTMRRKDSQFMKALARHFNEESNGEGIEEEEADCEENRNEAKATESLELEATETKKESLERRSSIYGAILSMMTTLPPSDDLGDPDLMEYLRKCQECMESQEELILTWQSLMANIQANKPKIVCPHSFSTRQISYLSLTVEEVCKALYQTSNRNRAGRLQSWEISGDILKQVLHQLRHESMRKKMDVKHCEKDTKSKGLRSRAVRTISRSLSFNRPSNQVLSDWCRKCGHNLNIENFEELGLEEPSTTATKRVIAWLWQLRSSSVGRLGQKAGNHLDELYLCSAYYSYFLEEYKDAKLLRKLALRSASAVTRIMNDHQYPVHVPLCAASKKGWLWSDMILCLSAWNKEKGYCLSVSTGCGEPRDIEFFGGSTGLSRDENDLDLEAITLAFHSELASPMGWNDIEDPRRPGPYAVPLIIFSSIGYYRQWEMVPGNIVQALIRLQKFHALQHIGTTLNPPHKKTALNEVRRLNKNASVEDLKFEGTILSKNFRRLATLRASQRKVILQKRPFGNYSSFFTELSPQASSRILTCKDINCLSNKLRKNETTITNFKGLEFECTRF